MSVELLITVFAASLLGSTHCAGMCGPIVLLMVGKPAQQSASPLNVPMRLLAYHLGRLTTYLTLGILFGLIGQSMNQSGVLSGLQYGMAYVAGATMLICATVLLLRQLGIQLRHLPIPSPWVKTIYSGFKVAQSWPPLLRAWWVGMLTTWIPCGWLYAFVIVAAGMAHPFAGAIVMLTFWLGTVPLLSFLGITAHQFSTRWRRAAPWIAIAACLTLGWMSLYHRSHLTWGAMQTHLTGATSTERLDQINNTKPACCHDD